MAANIGNQQNQKAGHLLAYPAIVQPDTAKNSRFARRKENKMGNVVKLPKLTNSHSVPEDRYRKDVSESMSYEEKRKIRNRNNQIYTAEQYKQMGIEVLEDYNDLFWSVKLPEGWRVERTDHHLWNRLSDEKGRERGTFFHKAALYDRDAFINFNTRYHGGVDHVADASEEYDIWTMSDYQGTIKDCDEIIFQTKCMKATGDHKKDEKIKEELWDILNAYISENLPDCRNIHAYWD